MRINWLNLMKIAPMIQWIPCALVQKCLHPKSRGDKAERPPPLEKVSGTCPCPPPDICICPCVNPCWRYPLQNILRTNKHTHTQTNSKRYTPACTSACRDNKFASYPHMPISLSNLARDCPASLSHLALQLSNALSTFHSLALGLTPRPNLAEACRRRHFTLLQSFSRIVQTVYDMCITKVFFSLF